MKNRKKITILSVMAITLMPMLSGCATVSEDENQYANARAVTEPVSPTIPDRGMF